MIVKEPDAALVGTRTQSVTSRRKMKMDAG